MINCGDGGRGHNKTLTIFEWFAFGDQPAMESEAIAFSDEIQREDIQICESVQFHLLLAEFLNTA